MADNDDPAPTYDVETLVDLKLMNGQEYVLVQWIGWPKEEDRTWEPVAELDAEAFAPDLDRLRSRMASAQPDSETKSNASPSVTTPDKLAAIPEPSETPVKRKRGRPPKVKLQNEASTPSHTTPLEPEVVVPEAKLVLPPAPVGESRPATPKKDSSLSAMAKQGVLLSKRGIKVKLPVDLKTKPIESAASPDSSNSFSSGKSQNITDSSRRKPSDSEESDEKQRDIEQPPKISVPKVTIEEASLEKVASRSGDNSQDSPLLEADESQIREPETPDQHPPESQTSPTSKSPEPSRASNTMMLLPRGWKSPVHSGGVSPATRQSSEEIVTHRMSGLDVDTSEDQVSPQPVTPSKSTPKRRGDAQAATQKKRARQRSQAVRDEDFLDDDDEPLSGSTRPATTARRRVGSQVRRSTKKGRSPSPVKPSPPPTPQLTATVAAQTLEPNAQTNYPPPLYMGSAVALLTPDFIRTIMREELDSFKQRFSNEQKVIVRHVGGPPPGCPNDLTQRWGLVEECVTGKQFYLPLEEIRLKYSQPLVDFLIKDAPTPS